MTNNDPTWETLTKEGFGAVMDELEALRNAPLSAPIERAELENLRSTIGRFAHEANVYKRRSGELYEKLRLLENRIHKCVVIGEGVDPDKLYNLLMSVPVNPRKKWNYKIAERLKNGIKKHEYPLIPVFLHLAYAAEPDKVVMTKHFGNKMMFPGDRIDMTVLLDTKGRPEIMVT